MNSARHRILLLTCMRETSEHLPEKMLRRIGGALSRQLRCRKCVPLRSASPCLPASPSVQPMPCTSHARPDTMSRLMKPSSVPTVIDDLTVPTWTVLLPAAAFLIPLLISGPQWLTGTAVNCLLILATAVLPGRFVWPVLFLPSLGALAHGALFGPFTRLLLLFVPFIWVGNWLFTMLFLSLRPSSGTLAVCAGALTKTAFLALSALVFFRFNVVPELFVHSMSLMQFFTAIAGGALALGILRFLHTSHE